ncbi:MAG: hypothetical protein HOD89_00220 [Thiotrichales bacterium]|jgi:hypothetical protein|nr:hypothetical protein [Thiotrichales bacterium]MBT3614069.1 hypothetical protein [Thiotrichales bacterium]MBT4260872.1 hypothetical protein [Thiotrichales bacterium]MBT5290530.1 hypothetical protein [Thiotrichales bacterium]MBT5417825.1 hypothetical protein [Thiotrichales bacterium]
MQDNKNSDTEIVPDDCQMGWDELRNTVLTLNLSVAQIEMSMRDGDQSVSTLIESFTTLAHSMRDIGVTVDGLDDSESDSNIKGEIKESVNVASSKVSAAVIAFQFYDKLSQRLTHVSSSLTTLINLVSDKEQIDSHNSWKELRERIRKTFIMVDEASVYEQIIDGVSIEKAIEKALVERDNEKDKDKEDDGDIDLF